MLIVGEFRIVLKCCLFFPTCKNTVMCLMEKMGVLDKLAPGMSLVLLVVSSTLMAQECTGVLNRNTCNPKCVLMAWRKCDQSLTGA